MITFTNLKTGEVKTAFSFRIDGEKTYITFTEGGKNTAIFLIMLKSMTRMQLLCLLRFTPLRRNVTAATGTLIF